MITQDNQKVIYMQSLIVTEQKARKPRAKRGVVPITYRLMPSVIQAVKKSAEKYGRSDNQQSEYLLKIGYLHTLGLKLYEMNDAEILAKFEEIAADLEVND